MYLCATVREYMRLIPRSRIVGLPGLENKLTLLTLINLKACLLSHSSTQTPTEGRKTEASPLSRPHFSNGADLNLPTEGGYVALLFCAVF